MRSRETIFPSESEVQRPRIGSAVLDEAPYSALFVVSCKLAGLPCGEARCSGDFSHKHPIPKIGGEQANSIELIGIEIRKSKRQQAAERNPAHPDGHSRGARRCDDFRAQRFERATI